MHASTCCSEIFALSFCTDSSLASSVLVRSIHRWQEQAFSSSAFLRWRCRGYRRSAFLIRRSFGDRCHLIRLFCLWFLGRMVSCGQYWTVDLSNQFEAVSKHQKVDLYDFGSSRWSLVAFEEPVLPLDHLAQAAHTQREQLPQSRVDFLHLLLSQPSLDQALEVKHQHRSQHVHLLAFRAYRSPNALLEYSHAWGWCLGSHISRRYSVPGLYFLVLLLRTFCRSFRPQLVLQA